MTRRVLLGVGGGIAAFKAAALCSQLVQRGADVRVAMTAAAREFVGPKTFAGLSGKPVILSATQVDGDGTVPHIAATRDLDCLVIAPATAGLLARIAAGCADDPVCLAALALPRDRAVRRIVCPAMNDAMWHAAAVQRNVRAVAALGFDVLGPVEGPLAEGYAAIGRMVEPDEILAAVLA